MTFDFDKIREDPQTAYIVGVVLGFALGFVVARKPPAKRPGWMALQGRAGPEVVRIVETPCKGCAEKAAVEAHVES